MLNIRKMNVDKEILRNCKLCDQVSSGVDTAPMYEFSSCDFESNSKYNAPRLYLCYDCLSDLCNSKEMIDSMFHHSKSFAIKVSADKRSLEFHTETAPFLIPVMPFIVGDDPMELKSNVPAIIKLIKDMMRVEGFGRVKCFKNDLAVYHEVISELKHIPGLKVITSWR